MKANDYVRDFDAQWRHYLMVPASSSRTGHNWSAGHWPDGSAAVVVYDENRGAYVLDWIDEPITDRAFDTMCHAAGCVACVSQERRAELVRKNLAATVGPVGPVEIIDGVRWGLDGSYRGINWS